MHKCFNYFIRNNIAVIVLTLLCHKCLISTTIVLHRYVIVSWFTSRRHSHITSVYFNELCHRCVLMLSTCGFVCLCHLVIELLQY